MKNLCAIRGPASTTVPLQGVPPRFCHRACLGTMNRAGSVVRASSPASSGGVSAPGTTPGETLGELAAETAALHGPWKASFRLFRMYWDPEADRSRTAACPKPQRMAISQAARTLRTLLSAARCELGQLAVPNRVGPGKASRITASSASRSEQKWALQPVNSR
jgi:hypothetical protein